MPKLNLKKTALCCLATGSLFLAGNALSQSMEKVMTLADAVASGVASNPEFGEVANNRQATEQELEQAWAQYFPSVDLQADGGYEYTENSSTRNDGDGDDSEGLGRYNGQVSVTQLLFDGFETQTEIDRQENRTRSADFRVRETSELVGLDIVEAYLEVIQQRDLLRIARDNVQKHLEILEQIDQGLQAGRSTQADVDQVRARLSAARAQEARTRQDLRVAEADFNREVGMMPGSLTVPATPYSALTDNVSAEVNQALENSPTLQIAEADIDVSEAEYDQTQSPFYPQFDLELSARGGENLNGIEESDKSAAALVLMNWNLYRGGEDTARRREFLYRLAESKETRSRIAREVENNVRQTWARMVASRERAAEFREQARANRNLVEAYFDQFNLDRRTLLDVLDAQNELFVSRSNIVNEETVEKFSAYNLLSLKGQLFPALGISYPEVTQASSQY